jgi:hypothetical protein
MEKGSALETARGGNGRVADKAQHTITRRLLEQREGLARCSGARTNEGGAEDQAPSSELVVARRTLEHSQGVLKGGNVDRRRKSGDGLSERDGEELGHKNDEELVAGAIGRRVKALQRGRGKLVGVKQ